MIPDKFDHQTFDILTSLGIRKPTLLGKGDQSWVFQYKKGTLIKIYRNIKREYLESLAKLEKTLVLHHLPFETPEIYDIGFRNGHYFTVEKNLNGRTLGSIFSTLSKKEKERAVKAYLGVIPYLSSVTLKNNDYGQVLLTGEEITASSWAEFLDRKLVQRVTLVRRYLEKDVRNLADKIHLMQMIIKKDLQCNRKCLVHGDYFYNNVLFDENLNILAVLDFSNSTVVGDYRTDVACGIMYFDLDNAWKDFLLRLAVKEYGEGILPIIRYYTAYQAFFQTESYFYNKGLYAWCLNHLNSDELWEFIRSSLR